MVEETAAPPPRDNMLPFAAGMFVIAIAVYTIFYSTDQTLRSKDGGWEVTFTTNQMGAAVLQLSLPSKGIENCSVVFNGEKLPPDFKPMTTNLVTPTHLPLLVPFGQWFYADLTYLPGVVTFNFFGEDGNATGRRHEVELLQRGLVVNREKHEWKPALKIEVSPEDKKNWPEPKID
jgi:hypothetical protein